MEHANPIGLFTGSLIIPTIAITVGYVKKSGFWWAIGLLCLFAVYYGTYRFYTKEK